MRKITVIMLCLILTLICAAGAAETVEKTNIGKVTVNGTFEVKGVLPEGYTMTTEEQAEDDGLFLTIKSDDPLKPVLLASIDFDETYYDTERLNDLNDEELRLLERTFTDEYDVDISYTETRFGTKLMVVKEKEGKFIDVFTIYRGYEFEFILIPTQDGGAQELTEDQIQMVVQFLGDLDFDPVGE